jgi:hypothetical protein
VNQEKTFVNVIVANEEPGHGDGTFIHTALMGQIKTKTAETMSFVVGAIDQSRAFPGSCNPHALMMTGLGQLYVNAMHLLASAEARMDFAKEVHELFENLSREVERVETMNEGGGTA